MMRAAMLAGRIGSAELADLVARGATRDFRIPVSSFSRLAALAPWAQPGGGQDAAPAGNGSSLSAHCAFQPGMEGHPQLHLVVAGTVPLVCQRCLKLLEWPVSVDVLLTLVGSDGEAAALADPFDTALLDEGDLRPEQVIEDEVLAALPLAPKHVESAACGGEASVDSGETHRPLAGLADLLGRGDLQGDK